MGGRGYLNHARGSHKADPPRASDYSQYSRGSSRPTTAQSQRTSSTMRTEEEALLRSTISRLDQLEVKLNQERQARQKAEDDLRQLQDMVDTGSARSGSRRGRNNN